MLPFLQNKDGVMAQPNAEELKDFGTLDAVAEDMMSAFHSKDHSRLKAALESLCEYLKSEDESQDQLSNS